jgi:SPFH domain/Band 7 family protein
MESRPLRTEITFQPRSGWPMVGLWFLLVGAVVALAVTASHLPAGGAYHDEKLALVIVPMILIGLSLGFLPIGFFVVSPNLARVLVLFGTYRGTVRREGFYWTNPFTIRSKVSLKAHNLNGQKLKVNDLMGNPIEIAAVVVWQVRDTARAKFDVEKFEEFVSVQSEAAVRALASAHPYDEGHTQLVATHLRGSSAEVARELQEILQQRLDRAGVEVIEARLSHLAYAPEIASAMLQRQQATAIIAARAMIVNGAVGMVEMALEQLSQKKVIDLDDERRAQLVGNLLVVLCSHENPHPVLNTGSLYT